MGMNEFLEAGKQTKVLHMFYVLDVSGSMVGEGIAQLNQGMSNTLQVLRDKFENSLDAHVSVSVMTFSTKAQWLTGTPASHYSEFIEDFMAFPDQSAAGLTNLGQALKLLNQGMHKDTGDQMMASATGNKRPIVIIMSDGQPTDNWKDELKRLNQNNRWWQQAIKIAIALGPQADRKVLEEVIGSNEAVLTVTDMSQFADMLVVLSITSSLANSVSRVDDGQGTLTGSDIVRAVVTPVEPEPTPVATLGEASSLLQTIPLDNSLPQLSMVTPAENMIPPVSAVAPSIPADDPFSGLDLD